MKLFAAAALFGLAIPGMAMAQEARIPISTTMERSCAGERSTVFTLDKSQTLPLNQPIVDTYSTRVYLTAAGDGYVLRQISDTSLGQLELVASLDASGAVSQASVSGSLVQAMQASSRTPIDTKPMANLAARDTYERLIIGRTYRVGDDYYPPQLGETIVGEMIAAMGLPFPAESSIDVVYRGLREEGGRQVHVFEGIMTVSLAGNIDGIQLDVGTVTDVRVTHDAATGLVTSVRFEAKTRTDVDRERVQETRISETLTCTIQPRQG